MPTSCRTYLHVESGFHQPKSMALLCRFYRHKYPKLDDVVMVNVRSIAEMGAYVSLLEYGNIEGMIMLSELTRRRIRSINKLVKIGRSECVAVIRVDEEKGTPDMDDSCINKNKFRILSGYLS